MKLHHWFIYGVMALLIGCATTDSHRDSAAGFLLVVDNVDVYEIDGKAVTLSPGQHRIDLVEDQGGPPIDSICTSSNTSIEATFTVFLRRLRLYVGDPPTVFDGGGEKRITINDNEKSALFSTCSL